jgi:hypothetical protein
MVDIFEGIRYYCGRWSDYRFEKRNKVAIDKLVFAEDSLKAVYIAADKAYASDVAALHAKGQPDEQEKLNCAQVDRQALKIALEIAEEAHNFEPFEDKTHKWLRKQK